MPRLPLASFLLVLLLAQTPGQPLPAPPASLFLFTLPLLAAPPLLFLECSFLDAMALPALGLFLLQPLLWQCHLRVG